MIVCLLFNEIRVYIWDDYQISGFKARLNKIKQLNLEKNIQFYKRIDP